MSKDDGVYNLADYRATVSVEMESIGMSAHIKGDMPNPIRRLFQYLIFGIVWKKL